MVSACDLSIFFPPLVHTYFLFLLSLLFFFSCAFSLCYIALSRLSFMSSPRRFLYVAMVCGITSIRNQT